MKRFYPLLILILIFNLPKSFGWTTCELAAEAKTGLNTTDFNGFDHVWYKFTATQNGVIKLLIPQESEFNIDSIKISSCTETLNSQYYTDFYSTQGLTVLIYTRTGNTYFWQFTPYLGKKLSGQHNWNLLEENLVYGWSDSTAQSLENDTFEVPKNIRHLIVFKYTAKTTGILSMKASSNFSSGEYVNFGINMNKSPYASSSIDYGNSFKEIFLDCTKDSVYYLSFESNAEDTVSDSFNVIVRELTPDGKSCQTPIIAVADTNTTSFEKYTDMWYKYTSTKDAIIKITPIQDPTNKYFIEYIYIDSCGNDLSPEYNSNGIYLRKGTTIFWDFIAYSWYDFSIPIQWMLSEESLNTTCENAQEVKNEINTTIFNENDQLWYKYTATKDGIIRMSFITNPTGTFLLDNFFVDSCNHSLSNDYYTGDGNDVLIYARKGKTYYFDYIVYNYDVNYPNPNYWKITEEEQTFGWSFPTAMDIDTGTYVYTSEALQPFKYNRLIYRYEPKNDDRLILKSSGIINSTGNTGFSFGISDSGKNNLFSTITSYRSESGIFKECHKDSFLYIILINQLGPEDTNNITLHIIERSLLPGESKNNPLTASEGLNTSNHWGIFLNDLYFIYKFTRSDTIEISSKGLTTEKTGVYVYHSNGETDPLSGFEQIHVFGEKDDSIMIKWSGEYTDKTYQWRLRFLHEPPSIVINKSISDIYVYPNPVGDMLYINSRGDNMNLKLYNLKGQQIINKKLFNHGNTIPLNVSDIAPGVYILKYESGNLTGTFIIRKY